MQIADSTSLIVKDSISEISGVQTKPFWIEVMVPERPTAMEFSIPDFDGFDPISGITD